MALAQCRLADASGGRAFRGFLRDQPTAWHGFRMADFRRLHRFRRRRSGSLSECPERIREKVGGPTLRFRIRTGRYHGIRIPERRLGEPAGLGRGDSSDYRGDEVLERILYPPGQKVRLWHPPFHLLHLRDRVLLLLRRSSTG